MRIIDAVVGQGNLVQQMKEASSLLPFEIGRRLAVSSELSETSVTQQHPSTVRKSLARSCVHERVAVIQPYLDMDTRPSESSMHKNIGTGAQKNSSRCSGLMSQNLYYLLLQKYSQIQIHHAIPSGRHTIGPYSALAQWPQTYM